MSMEEPLLECARCHTPVGWGNIVAQESMGDIYRCPSCGKPVIVVAGIVKKVTQGG